MKPANTKEYFQYLCGHLYDGGEVKIIDGNVAIDSLGVKFFPALVANPEGHTIIERPMVYVYQHNENKEMLLSVTTYQVREKESVSVDSYFGPLFHLYRSFPIEEQTND